MIVLVIGVAVVLVLSLAFLGAFGGGSSGTPSQAVPFSTAQGLADGIASAHGSWTLYAAVGMDAPVATTTPLNLSSVSNCTVTSFAGPIPSELSIPAFHGNLTSGTAEEWVFDFIQPGAQSELAVAVIGGTILMAVEISGPCLGSIPSVSGVPSGIVDSPTAMAAAASVGGTAFLAAHPQGVYLEMDVFAAPSEVGAPTYVNWNVEFQTCPTTFTANETIPPGVTFSVAVNATTGDVVPNSEFNSTCGSTAPTEPIWNALTIGGASEVQGPGTGGTVESQGCTSGDACYSLPIEATADNVTAGDFTLSVMNQSFEIYGGVIGYAILSSTGQVIVWSTGSVENAWSSGIGSSTTLLSAGMVLMVDIGSQIPTGSYSLEMTGLGPFANSEQSIGLS
jgi:hypothetical protein